MSATLVRNLGPLFVTSCFGFETLNGQLLYLIKGTQSIGTQVAHAVHTLQVLPLYATKYIMPTTTEDILYRRLCGKLDRANETCIEGNIHVIGCQRKHQLDSTHIKKFHNFINCTCTQFSVYTRIRIHSAEIHSLLHTAPKKRNGYTIAYGWHDKIKFGEVLYFINILHNPTCSNQIVLVAAIKSFVKPIDNFLPMDTITNATAPHIHAFNQNYNDIVFLPVGNIITKCVNISFQPELLFVVCPPNLHETD